MNSGLTVVVLINIVVVAAALVFYRYVILHEAGLLNADEVQLLAKYPGANPRDSYTPSDAFVPAPPPMRWTGWSDFFQANDQLLSRDAQVYLLFQRACILTTAACGAFASVVLLPWYWLGGNLFRVGESASGDKKPLTLLNMLRSDRGVFEQFTSHNLSPDSPVVLLQFPVMVVVAFCIIFMYTAVKTSAGESRTIMQWLNSTSSRPSSSRSQRNANAEPGFVSPGTSPLQFWQRKEWTVFARGLPMDIRNASELSQMLSAIYPSQVAFVELVCKGRMSEAKLKREFMSAKYRYEYLLSVEDDEMVDPRLVSRTIFGRIFGLFVRRLSREEVLHQLREKIITLERDVESRKASHMRGFQGCAFITFSTRHAAASAVHDFPLRLGHGWMRNWLRGDMIDSPSSSFESPRSPRLLAQSPVKFASEKLQFGFPSLGNLYRAIVNILPDGARDWVIATPWLAPRAAPVDMYHSSNILASGSRNVRYSPELAVTRLRHMKATRAPKSADIIWDNIGISFLERTVREIIVQFVVFAILILFTSPIAMLTAVKFFVSGVALLSDPQVLAHSNPDNNPLVPTIDVKKENAAVLFANYMMEKLPKALAQNDWLRSAIFTYVPVLLLAIVFAVVPSLLRLTCRLEGYPTHSAQEMSVFRKTAFYYVMNAVVLPSLALNTTSEFLDMIYQQSNGGANISSALPILERLFSGDIAFFVCNYLVQLALTGSVFWLMRLPSSFSMMIRRRMALTPLEAAEAKCTDIFDYPRHYAYCVTVMSMALLFGFMAPVVWWFSFVYFVIKHLVDLYLIRYVHPRTHIDGRLPRLSITFVLVWTVVSQLSIAVIFYLQSWVKACIATVLLCALTLGLCLSAGPEQGNRILALLAKARGQILERVIGDGSNIFGWLLQPGLTTERSNSFGSSVEIVAPAENDALLSTPASLHNRPTGRSRTISLSLTSVPADEYLYNQLIAQSELGKEQTDSYGKRSAHTSTDTRVEGTVFGDADDTDLEYDEYDSEENVGVDVESNVYDGRRMMYRTFENGG